MSTRVFEHFPEGIVCPLCQTNEDKECVLIPINGTQEGLNVEAKPIHLDCLLDSLWLWPEKKLILCPAYKVES